MFTRGMYVQTWFDTGAGRTGGARILYGIVIKAGKKTATILWESGRRNVVRHDAPKGVQCVHTAAQTIAADVLSTALSQMERVQS